MRKSTIVVFDKTGTITEGKPKLVEIKQNGDASQNLSVLSSLENLSSHPIAHAIVIYAKEHDVAIQDVTDFHNIEGVGVEGNIDGKKYIVSKPSYATTLGLNYDEETIATRTLQ